MPEVVEGTIWNLMKCDSDKFSSIGQYSALISTVFAIASVCGPLIGM
jgi:hypothetical protein